MHTLDFIFRLGILFAIYGFLWGLFEIGIGLLVGMRTRSLWEIYLIKAVKYFFLVDVTFLFCFDDHGIHLIIFERLVYAGIVLLTYFLGKLQHSQNRMVISRMMDQGAFNFQTFSPFNLRFEIALIILSIVTFIFFSFQPEWASNPLSLWFHEMILGIEKAPVFGFIFKIIGFFVLLGLINKMISAFTFLLNKGIESNSRRRGNDPDDEYANFEEIDD